jgi:hypothetical protein
MMEKTKKDVLSKLSRLGVEINANDLYDDSQMTPEQYAEDVGERQMEADMHAYETYERCRAVLRGIHTADIILGNSRIAVSCTGLDVFDLFPEPHSLIDVKKHLDEREAASVHKDALLTSKFVDV